MDKNRRRVLAATLALVAVVVSAGCGTSSNGSQGSGGSAAAATTKAGTAPPKKGFTIGYDVPVVANPYWQQNIQFAKKMASELGVSLLVENDNGAADAQLANFQDLIAKGVKAIVFAPVNTAIGPALLKVCQTNNIVCAADERKFPVQVTNANRAYFAGYVVGDDLGLAAQAAQALGQADARNCVALSGAVGNSVADLRLQGFEAYAKSHGMKVLSTFRPAELAADGLTATENFLSQLPGPKFNCLYSFDGDAADGAIKALANAGVLSKVKVAAVGPTPDNLAQLKAGQMLNAIGGTFMDGGLAVIMAYDALNGRHATGGSILLQGVNVDKSNVARYTTQFGNPAAVQNYNAQQLSATYNPRATSAGFKIVLR